LEFSLARYRHARHRTTQTGEPNACPFAPRGVRWDATDQRSRARRQARPARDRLLETAFRSPVTAVRCRTTMAGSKFPACFFAALPDFPQARSAGNSTAHRRFADAGGINAANPLPDSTPALPMLLRNSTPLRELSLPSDRSVPSDSALESPPDSYARWPFAPRRGIQSKLVAASDQRSGLATSLPACCSTTSWNLSDHAPEAILGQMFFA
jgi:hypothetical protein